eukprot:TRINITY_DN3488_c1_g1_i12.p1 TRINITY_DN3488_c1_g1~~TRINITY_DN3488_c1_g1_i12.p1  ORF type:complete len:370 (-),score=106.62 TRINITY_DN3488_c1_g1_i12:266-1375(-)
MSFSKGVVISMSESQRQKGDELRMRAAGIDPTKIDEQWSGEVMSRRVRREARVDEEAEQNKRDAREVPTELRDVLHEIKPEKRARWLHKALTFCAKGSIKIDHIYEVVRDKKFVQGVNGKVGFQCKQLVMANSHLFNSKQQKFLQSDSCKLSQFTKEDAEEAGGEKAEKKSKKKEKKRRSPSDSRGRSFSRERSRSRSRTPPRSPSRKRGRRRDREDSEEDEEMSDRRDKRDKKKTKDREKEKSRREKDLSRERPREKEKVREPERRERDEKKEKKGKESKSKAAAAFAAEAEEDEDDRDVSPPSRYTKAPDSPIQSGSLQDAVERQMQEAAEEEEEEEREPSPAPPPPPPRMGLKMTLNTWKPACLRE